MRLGRWIRFRHLQSLTRLLLHHLQIRLLQVSADKTQLGGALPAEKLKEPNRAVSFPLMPALLRGKDADSIATLFAGSDGSEAGDCDPARDGRPRDAWPSGLAYKDAR